MANSRASFPLTLDDQMSPAHSEILGEVISKITPNWKKKIAQNVNIFTPKPKTKNSTPNINLFATSWKQNYTKHKKCYTKSKNFLYQTQKSYIKHLKFYNKHKKLYTKHLKFTPNHKNFTANIFLSTKLEAFYTKSEILYTKLIGLLDFRTFPFLTKSLSTMSLSSFWKYY